MFDSFIFGRGIISSLTAQTSGLGINCDLGSIRCDLNAYIDPIIHKVGKYVNIDVIDFAT